MTSHIKLRDYQEVAVADIRAEFGTKNTPVLFVLPTGGGKCLGKGTPVLMFNGDVVPVEAVRVGDLLMGPDSKPRTVLSLARGREAMYRVTPVKGDSYVVNESHILSLRNERTGAIRNICVLDYLAEPRHWRMRNLGWRVPGVLRGDLTLELGYITVDPIGEGDYFGFEIDGDHLFMLGDFTVTHNTFTFSYIAANAAQKHIGRAAKLGGKPAQVMIIVHRKELLLQASRSLSDLRIDHGLISPHFTPDPRAIVQVASVDTLLQRMKKTPNAFNVGLLIFDEAHHVVDGNKWGRAFEQLGSPPMLGVTATPVRSDGKGLGSNFGGVFKVMVTGPSVADLIARGSLIDPLVYASPIVPDISDLKTNRDGDYNLHDLAARVDKPKITGNAVAHYTELCPGARAIVFCSSIAHAKHVAEQFNAAGYKFDLLVGAPEMSDAARTDVNRKLRAGEIHGACTVDLVSEGYDLPDLECCIMLRPTASEALFLQQVGRVMRPSEGKTKCWLLDHVANVGTILDGAFKRKHGLPNEAREWSLEGRKKKKKGPKEVDETVDIVQCPDCYLAHEAAPECPKCGHIYPVKASREIEQVDGALMLITEEMQQRVEAEQKAQQRTAQASAQTVQEMMDKLGYPEKRARAIVEAREEKAALRQALVDDLLAWQKTTGESPQQALGIYISDMRMFKPKQLKETRARFDEHCAQVAAGGKPNTGGQQPAF